MSEKKIDILNQRPSVIRSFGQHYGPSMIHVLNVGNAVL